MYGDFKRCFHWRICKQEQKKSAQGLTMARYNDVFVGNVFKWDPKKMADYRMPSLSFCQEAAEVESLRNHLCRALARVRLSKVQIWWGFDCSGEERQCGCGWQGIGVPSAGLAQGTMSLDDCALASPSGGCTLRIAVHRSI
jgi:hypothetical protein